MLFAEILPSYQSIGEFYKELQNGERTLWLSPRRRLT